MLYKVSILSSADRQPNPCQVDGWWDYRKLSANPKGSPLPWGEFSDRKDRLACCKFWKEPLRGSRVLYCGRGLNFFHLQEESHIISFHFFCLAKYPKSCCKSSHCRPFEAEYPVVQCTETTFLTSKRYEKQAVLFLWDPTPTPHLHPHGNLVLVHYQSPKFR